jgi:integrase
MAAIALTPKFLDALKPREKEYETPDKIAPGLYIKVETTGRRTFVFRYRFERKPKKLTIGRYPLVTLANARQKARDYATTLAGGADPDPRKIQEAQVCKMTVEDLCRDYATLYLPQTSRTNRVVAMRYLGLTVDKTTGKLVYTPSKGDVIRRLGSKTVDEVTPKDIIGMLDEIVARGSPITANRVLAYLRSMYAWAVGRAVLAASPCAAIKKPTKETPRRHLIQADEIRAIWEVSAFLGAGPEATYNAQRDAFRMLVLTGQRKSIVRNLRWEDLGTAVWTIDPASEGAKGIPNLLPVTSTMRQIFDVCPHRSGYIFSTTGGKKPLYLGDNIKNQLDTQLESSGHKVRPWTFHDLRTFVRTGLADLAIPDGAIVRELLIGHRIPGMHSVYDQNQYLPQKKTGLDLWEGRLKEMLTVKQ